MKSMYSNLPQGPCFATVTLKSPSHACFFIRHSLRSCTPSEAQTGLRITGHLGQTQFARLFTTRQPMLYGALQPSVSQGSVEKSFDYSPFKSSCLCNKLTLKINLKIPAGVVGAGVVPFGSVVGVCVTLGVVVIVVVGSVTKGMKLFEQTSHKLLGASPERFTFLDITTHPISRRYNIRYCIERCIPRAGRGLQGMSCKRHAKGLDGAS